MVRLFYVRNVPLQIWYCLRRSKVLMQVLGATLSKPSNAMGGSYRAFELTEARLKWTYARFAPPFLPFMNTDEHV